MSILTQLIYIHAHVPVSAGAHHARVINLSRAEPPQHPDCTPQRILTFTGAQGKNFSVINTEVWYFKFCQGSRGRGVSHKRVPHLHVKVEVLNPFEPPGFH